MRSITGIEYNNPKVCIKDMDSSFACVCAECSDANHKMVLEYIKNPDEYLAKRQFELNPATFTKKNYEKRR